jgi:hypothetical protein
VSGKISGVKTTSKRSVRPAKKIKLHPATASEILKSLNPTPLEERRAKAAFETVMYGKRASAPKRESKVAPKTVISK